MLPNEIKSTVDLPKPKIIALCESMLSRMEDNDLRRIRNSDPDRFFNILSQQFTELKDRYPGIFNVLVLYGRKTPDGFDTLARIKRILQLHDTVVSGEKTEDEAHVELDYEYSYKYVRPALGAAEFDRIVPVPGSGAPAATKKEPGTESK
jgi:hypothetical protein